MIERIGMPVICSKGYAITGDNYQVMIEPGRNGIISSSICQDGDDVQILTRATVLMRMPREDALKHFDPQDYEPVL